MLTTPIGRLRLTGLLEGVSFLVLLLIAMPLKYAAGRPHAVEIVGWVHGVLFLLYLFAIVAAVLQANLRLKLAGLAAVAALVPAGPFLLDPKLKREADAHPHQQTPHEPNA